MRLIVFSDIHGNSYALDAFFVKIKELTYDMLIFCGDIFGYYYNQKQVIEKLSEREDLIWLKGNHDQYFLNLYNGKTEKEYFIQNYGHSYDNISERYSSKDAMLIDSHPSEYLLMAGERCVGIFHGTPENSLEGRLYPDKPLLHRDKYECYDIVILGHTHCRMLRMEGKTLVVNPGSLGQPRDGQGYGFALVDTEQKTAVFYNVEIDASQLYRQIDMYDPDLRKLKEVLERRI